MVEPFSADSDDARVEGLLGRVSRLASIRVIEGEDIHPKAFGLSEPTLKVKVGLQNGRTRYFSCQRTPLPATHSTSSGKGKKWST